MTCFCLHLSVLLSLSDWNVMGQKHPHFKNNPDKNSCLIKHGDKATRTRLWHRKVDSLCFNTWVWFCEGYFMTVGPAALGTFHSRTASVCSMFASAVFLALDYLSSHTCFCETLFLADLPRFTHSSPNHGCTKNHIVLRFWVGTPSNLCALSVLVLQGEPGNRGRPGKVGEQVSSLFSLSVWPSPMYNVS